VDNGRGFSPGAANQAARANGPAANGTRPRQGGFGNGGFGLTSLTERARIIGGQMTIESAPGHGAAVTIRISSDRDEKRN
jgi:signal transduction histidine kinase